MESLFINLRIEPYDPRSNGKNKKFDRFRKKHEWNQNDSGREENGSEDEQMNFLTKAMLSYKMKVCSSIPHHHSNKLSERLRTSMLYYGYGCIEYFTTKLLN